MGILIGILIVLILIGITADIFLDFTITCKYCKYSQHGSLLGLIFTALIKCPVCKHKRI